MAGRLEGGVSGAGELLLRALLARVRGAARAPLQARGAIRRGRIWGLPASMESMLWSF
jgi:hypothetical protein